MSNISEAKQERQRKTLQREILRAQNNAQTRAGSGRKRDWGSIVLVAIIFLLICVAAFLFWVIASGRVGVPSANAQTPTAQQTGDTNPDMANAWQGAASGSTITIDPNYVEDTMFVGDSNTVRLWMLGLVEEEQCLAQDSIGIGAVTGMPLTSSSSTGYQTYGYTILQSIERLQPQRIVMTIGSNDIGGTTAEGFIYTYRNTIAAIREVCDCEIIVNSIYPARQWNEYPNLYKDTIEEFNEALEEMCRQDGIPFLNSYNALVGEDGWCKPEYTVEDGVHLNEEGLQMFLDYYKKARTRLNSGGSREVRNPHGCKL